MAWVVLDFETRSFCDLKQSGAAVYAQDPSTEVMCLGFSINGEPVHVWRPEYVECPTALADAIRSGAMLVAHNVIFEKSIWRSIMVPLYRWPLVPSEQWFDTMASCAYRALPLKLGRAAQVLRLPTQKGETPTKYFKPAKSGAFVEPGIDLYQYNVEDVEAEVGLLRRLRIPPESERRIFYLDQKINERGVAVDLQYVAACQRVVEKASAPLAQEFASLTGGLRPAQAAKVIQWAWSEGALLDNLKAETIKEFIGENEWDEEYDYDADVGDEVAADKGIHLPATVRRALEIRRILGSASIKKLTRIPFVVGADGRARGLLQYHGATTGRWTGRLLQPQNFPRGSAKLGGGKPPPDVLVSAMLSEDIDYVELLFGDPIAAVASGLRHCLVSDAGHSFVVGDFSTVEARVLLALAGQHDRVAALARGDNLYVPVAEQIYGRTINKEVDVAEYTIGKNSVLGCGFQMGHNKFSLRYAKHMPLDFCKEVVRVYREEFAPEVPKVWNALGKAALNAVRTPGAAYEAYGVQYKVEDEWLTARIPSGRKLFYFGPHLASQAMPWDPDDVRQIWRYWVMKSGQWRLVNAYGGSLTANVVQASARDLLCEAALKCEVEGLPVVLTVHDEIVSEVSSGRADPKVLNQIMCDAPAWARELGIPIAAECWAGNRYRK